MPSMLKLLFGTLAILFFLCLPAQAKVQTFSKFTADVPEGWGATEDADNYTVTFIAKDKTAAMTISIGPSEDNSAETIARQLAAQFEAAAPQKDDDTGGYSFEFKNENGVESVGLVFKERDQAIIFFFFGDHPDFGKIMDSIK